MAERRYRSRSHSPQSHIRFEELAISTKYYDRVVYALYNQLPKSLNEFCIGHVIYIMFVREKNKTGNAEKTINYIGSHYQTITADMEMKVERVYEQDKGFRKAMTKHFDEAVDRLKQPIFTGQTVISSSDPTDQELKKMRDNRRYFVEDQIRLAIDC